MTKGYIKTSIELNMVLRKIYVKANRWFGKYIIRASRKEIRAVEKLYCYRTLIYEYREL